ncbi:MAG: hypothetical protein Q8R00_03270 [Candidatus Nanoarchaeia archaeon]|nr:hypothetical protein [Candidatus Nanoarchaeia archaeon]
MRKLTVLMVLVVFLVGCQTVNNIFAPKKAVETTEEVEETIPAYETIIMKGGIFDKNEVTIKKGGTVTWKNEDEDPYFFNIYTTVENERSKEINKIPSGKILAGQQFTHTFDIVGEHNIIPLWHGRLRGKVIVVE